MSKQNFVSKGFEKACNHSVDAPYITKVCDGIWVFSDERDNNVPINFMNYIDPNFISTIKSGELSSQLQVLCHKDALRVGDKRWQDVLSLNRFQISDLDGSLLIDGRWWGMKGSEFSEIYKDIPMTYGEDDVIVCDVCPVQ